MSRSPIVRPQNPQDVVLRLVLTVTPEKAITLNYNDGLATMDVARSELVEIFQQTGHDLKNGIFTLEITAEGVRAEADIYSAQEWTAILNQEATFGKVLKSHFNLLMTAYRGMVQESDQLDIVRAAVERAIKVNGDTLEDEVRFPSVDQLLGMQFRGGCATCSFADRSFNNVMAMVLGRGGGKVQLAEDVTTVHGINVRAVLEEDGSITAIVGFLAHENHFSKAFHEDLVGQLRPLLTTELVRSVIQEYLVVHEHTRRMLVRRISKCMETYGFNIYDVAALTDAEEAQIREDARRRQDEASGYDGSRISQLFEDMMSATGDDDFDDNSDEPSPTPAE